MRSRAGAARSLAPARQASRLRGLARPVQSLGFYFHHVALRALGWRVSVRLVEIVGLNGATVIVCAILVAGLCWALITGSGQSRAFIVVALITGFVQSVVAATVVPVVIRQQYQAYFEGGSRYATMPIMAMTAAAVVAVDARLHRQASAEGGDRNALIRKSPRALAAVAVLACVLALSWVLDYRYVTQRMFWGHWQPVAERMLTACEHSSSDTITTWTWGNSTITIPCSRLHR